MSGREPVAAFFPSIDRNLIAELDRHLRGPQHPAAEATHMSPASQSLRARPDISDVVEAVEHAASSMSAMSDRIAELEAHIASLDATNRALNQQLGQTSQKLEAMETKSRADVARAEQAERFAAHHLARADGLEQDLATAMSDLTRITDAIANTLGLPETR